MDEARPSRQEQLRAALAVRGKYRDSSGETRVAREHDQHLDAAYGASGAGPPPKPPPVMTLDELLAELDEDRSDR